MSFDIYCKLVEDRYGVKVALKFDYNDKIVQAIRDLDWERTHRQFKAALGNAWTVDLDSYYPIVKPMLKGKFPEVVFHELDLPGKKEMNPYDFRAEHAEDKRFVKLNFKQNQKIVDALKHCKAYYDPDNEHSWFLLKSRIGLFLGYVDKMHPIFENVMAKFDESTDDSKFLNIKVEKQAILYDIRKLPRLKEFILDVRKIIGFKHPHERSVRKWSSKDLSNWDGMIVPVNYDWKEGRMIFDVGWIGQICKLIEENYGMFVNIDDNRPFHTLKKDLHFRGIELWKHQDAAWQHMVNELKEKGNTMIQSATGSGKTEICMKLMEQLGLRTIILVNRKDLLKQWSVRIKKRLGGIPGIIGDGIYNPKVITVATLQSLWAYLKKNSEYLDPYLDKLIREFIEDGNNDEIDDAPISDPEIFKKFSLVILDEVHIGAANTFLYVLRSFTSKYFVGVSATTERSDKMHPLLWGVFGKPNFRYTINDGIADKILVPPKFVIIRTGLSFYGKYPSVMKQMKESPENNEIISKIVARSPKPGLVITAHKTHQKHMYNAIKKRTSKVVVANGATKLDERYKILNYLDEKQIKIAIATGIWDMGVDAPGINSMFLVFPTKSWTNLIQRIGRGVRSKSEKKECIVFYLWHEGDHLPKYNKVLLDLIKKNNWEYKFVDAKTL